MHRRAKRLILSLFCITFFVSMVSYIVIGYLPNFKMTPPNEYLEDMDGIQTVLRDERITSENHPILRSGEMYIPADFVKNHIDKYIFWDDKYVILTTDTEVIRMKSDFREGDMAYLSAVFLESRYNIEIVYDTYFSIVTVDLTTESQVIGEVRKKVANVRYEAHKKSPIQQKLNIGDTMLVFDEFGDYTKIRTDNGLTGYMLTKDIQIIKTEPPKVLHDEPIPKTTEQSRINVVWDVFTNGRMTYNGLDVLSPVWFSLDNKKLNGDIIDGADISYVKWAHENGYKVWALINDKFDPDAIHAILSDSDIREHVINQILSFIDNYDLDGINIDFEAVRAADAKYYLQFLRELAPMMRQKSAVLSADVFVPTYTKYYNRTEMANVVDYIMVMAYDEHSFYSDVSGPVASIEFVEQGILDTLEEVPKEKVILGLPYYVRIWREEYADDFVTVGPPRDVGMDYAYSIFKEAGAEFEWLEDLKCYYGQYSTEEEGNKVVYKVWLEDLKSIEEKLKIADKYDIAGVSGWRRDLESHGVWDLISDYKEGKIEVERLY